MSASSPANRKDTRGCALAAVADYRHFSLHHAIQFHPVESIATQYQSYATEQTTC